jgi:GntR family transcriptional regulator/MocR family aminotransferase
MSRVSSAAIAAALAPDPRSSEPLYRQICERLRRHILNGTFPAGQQIQSSRVLAADLGVSRNTIMNAIEQLIAEGYLEGQPATGTFVTGAIPEALKAPSAEPPAVDPRWSSFGERLDEAIARPPSALTRLAPFRPGVGALDAFPFDVWQRLFASVWRTRSIELLDYGHPAGDLTLRRAIAAYMRIARGIQAEAAQILIVSGAQQGIELTARLLVDRGEQVWVEDPGYFGIRSALQLQDAALVPVPVDEAGLVVQRGMAAAPGARLACVAPSHQFPRGVTMTLARRLELLNWAASAGAWILEDDYDGEFTLHGPPLQALQGLDGGRRVIYLGTFSKTLFPSLRLAYLVVPPDLVDRFVACKAAVDRQCPVVEQAVLARFIVDGHFARHIRRMRALYAERAEALVASAQRHLVGALTVEAPTAGMHAIGWLEDGRSDEAVSRAAAEQGVVGWPLSSCRFGNAACRPGLVLGFAAYTGAEIDDAIVRLARALESR